MFTLQVLVFENGNFVSVTEGNEKIGSMMISLTTSPGPVTTSIIPGRAESLFLKLTAERLSSLVRGISLVSINVQKELDTNSMKQITNELVSMIRNV